VAARDLLSAAGTVVTRGCRKGAILHPMRVGGAAMLVGWMPDTDDMLSVSSDVTEPHSFKRALKTRLSLYLLALATVLIGAMLGFWVTNRPATDLHPGDFVRTRDRDNFGWFVSYVPDAAGERLAVIKLADGERAAIPLSALVVVERKKR